jgi:S-(hydroxymethyl)glutathione dehydrogenase / alcohol dehydrogenase
VKAAVLTKLNSTLEIADVEPGPLKYGQVLVRVLASGICGSQLQEIAGHKGNGEYLPHLLGHEGCGMVEGIGEGVSRVKLGDKVVMHWRKAAGIESENPKYKFNDRIITSGRVTTFSQMSICSENRVTSVPRETSDEFCALLGCGLSTALGTVERDASLRMGESILIIGVGGLGCNLIRAADLAHATPIFAIDSNEQKGPLANLMGAHVCRPSWPGILDWLGVYKISGFDVVIDTTGDPHAISMGLTLLNPSGRFVMVGQPKPGENVSLMGARLMFDGEGKSIKATQGGGFQPHLDIPRYTKLSPNILQIDKIITHRVKLEDINNAIELVRNGCAGRIIVIP